MEIVLNEVLNNKGFIELDFPKENPFIIKASRYGLPEYKNIMIDIGVKSNEKDYDEFNGFWKPAVLLHLKTHDTKEVPLEIAEEYFKAVLGFVEKYQKELYPLISNNYNVYNSVTKVVEISTIQMHSKPIYYTDLRKDEKILLELYESDDYWKTFRSIKFQPNKQRIKFLLKKYKEKYGW